VVGCEMQRSRGECEVGWWGFGGGGDGVGGDGWVVGGGGGGGALPDPLQVLCTQRTTIKLQHPHECITLAL